MDFHRLISQTKDTPADSPEIQKDYTFVESSTFEFPLKHYSTDVAILRSQGRRPTLDKLPQDSRLFLEVLELSCTGEGIEELEAKFQELTNFLRSNIINRLDRYQTAAPLHYACMNGHISVVKFLLVNGADVDIWDGVKKVTPLICAGAHGHQETVNLLLEHGCDIDAGLNGTDQSGSALLWAVKGNQPEVVQILLTNNCGQNSTFLYSETPIHAAVMVGSPTILDMLIINGEPSKVDVHMGKRRDTPLHLAARGEYPNFLETCQVLLQKGNVSVNETNASGKTALHLAAAANKPEVIKLLLNHWASVDIQDKDGRTALFQTISDASDSLKTLEELIFRGKSDVNHQDSHGYTALHLAAHRGAEGASEILLMGGADFSLKSTGGQSALSILNRKVPNICSLLQKVFDQAVTISQHSNPNDVQGSSSSSSSPSKGSRKDCRIEVNFKYVLPSQPSSGIDAADEQDKNKEKTSTLRRMASMFTEIEAKENDDDGLVRKETTKMKCLVDEGLTGLLLHPVVHSFLEMKWQKVRPIMLPTILFKIAFVLLFSAYVEMPYWFHMDAVTNTTTTVAVAAANMTIVATAPPPGRIPSTMKPLIIMKMLKSSIGDPKVHVVFYIMWYILVPMVTLKALMELTHFLRAPKTQWKSLEHWISITVLVILIINLKPLWWGRKSKNEFHRSIAALGILLAWIDIWINISRFPNFGQSIRAFFQVFKTFTMFMLPHFCLFAGFLMSLTLLHPINGEFTLAPLTVAKMVRISAGDITISREGMEHVKDFTTTKQYISHFILVAIYTGFVLMVPIVLMNLLVGLAVNDIHGINAQASINKLVKQTLLLNTLESNFKGRLVKIFLSKTFQANYINLFKPGTQNKTLVFKPFNSRDQKVSAELKQALLKIDSGNVQLNNAPTETPSANSADDPNPDSSRNVRIWQTTVSKLIQGKEEDQKILMDKIGELVSEFMTKRSRATMASQL